MSPGSPIIIAVAPNGARKTKTDHLALPVSPDELAEEAALSLTAGASMIHLHVRGEDGEHSLDVARYQSAIEAIRTKVGEDMIIQVTSEAVGLYNAVQQMAMVRELRPEAVSLAIREICPQGASEKEVAQFLHWMQQQDISPQYILYSVEDVLRFEGLRQRGVIPQGVVNILYVLGRYSETGVSSPVQLLPLLDVGQQNVVWSVCAFGSQEAACMLTAAGLGGHCRVGFENNMHLANGEVALNNAALIEQISEHCVPMGRQPASPSEARKLLGMKAL